MNTEKIQTETVNVEQLFIGLIIVNAPVNESTSLIIVSNLEVSQGVVYVNDYYRFQPGTQLQIAVDSEGTAIIFEGA